MVGETFISSSSATDFEIEAVQYYEVEDYESIGSAESTEFSIRENSLSAFDCFEFTEEEKQAGGDAHEKAKQRLALYLLRGYNPCLPWDKCICCPSGPGKPLKKTPKCTLCYPFVDDPCPSCTPDLYKFKDVADFDPNNFTCFRNCGSTCPWECTYGDKLEALPELPEEGEGQGEEKLEQEAEPEPAPESEPESEPPEPEE